MGPTERSASRSGRRSPAPSWLRWIRRSAQPITVSGCSTGSKLLGSEGQTTRGLPSEYGGGGDIGGSIASFETLAFGDLSLLVKTGVQFGLFGGAILQLGTRVHHDEYLADIASVELPGCFAMSESGHGSDVQSVGTTATYDYESRQWIIDTPSEADRKDWIGNAAAHGRAAVVFAQLITGDENHGVHAFVVPIRDRKGRVAEGVRIEDVRPQARAERRRQRPPLLRLGANPPGEPARPVRIGDRQR